LRETLNYNSKRTTKRDKTGLILSALNKYVLRGNHSSITNSLYCKIRSKWDTGSNLSIGNISAFIDMWKSKYIVFLDVVAKIIFLP
jgi:hypothetical protein